MEEIEDEPLFADRVAGLDIAKAAVEVTIRVPSDTAAGRRRQETPTFGATRRELLDPAAWLQRWEVTKAGMEATGDYWKPVFFLPGSQGLDCELYNAGQVKALPGRPKTGRAEPGLARQDHRAGHDRLQLRAARADLRPGHHRRDRHRYDCLCHRPPPGLLGPVVTPGQTIRRETQGQQLHRPRQPLPRRGARRSGHRRQPHPILPRRPVPAPGQADDEKESPGRPATPCSPSSTPCSPTRTWTITTSAPATTNSACTPAAKPATTSAASNASATKSPSRPSTPAPANFSPRPADHIQTKSGGTPPDAAARPAGVSFSDQVCPPRLPA